MFTEEGSAKEEEYKGQLCKRKYKNQKKKQ